MDKEIQQLIGAAIANARGMRRGAPFVENVLDILPDKLRIEVLDDAEAIIQGLKNADYSIVKNNPKENK